MGVPPAWSAHDRVDLRLAVSTEYKTRTDSVLFRPTSVQFQLPIQSNTFPDYLFCFYLMQDAKSPQHRSQKRLVWRVKVIFDIGHTHGRESIE